VVALASSGPVPIDIISYHFRLIVIWGELPRPKPSDACLGLDRRLCDSRGRALHTG
jgi:hypothetical protein